MAYVYGESPPEMGYFFMLLVYDILGDPGADSGGEGKSKQVGKYGTREK